MITFFDVSFVPVNLVYSIAIVSGFMSAPIFPRIAFHVKKKSRTSSRLKAEPQPGQRRLRVSILFSIHGLQKVCRHFIKTTDLRRVEQMLQVSVLRKLSTS